MRNRWQTWRPPQDPGQSLGFLHSPRLVLATTFGCPNGQQHANLSSFLIISDTVAVSPRLHSSSSVRNAPWLAQMNFSISDSITHTHTRLEERLLLLTECVLRQWGSAVGIVSEVWKPKQSFFFYDVRAALLILPTRGRHCVVKAHCITPTHTQHTEKVRWTEWDARHISSCEIHSKHEEMCGAKAR